MLWSKIYIVIFWMLVFNVSVNAQEISQLTERLQNAKTSDEKFNALVNLSDYWSYRDTTKAFEMLRNALPLTAGNPFLQGVYYFYEAGVHFGYDNARSQQLYLKADEYLQKYHTPEAYKYRARLWNNYGVLEQMADNDKALLDITIRYCIPFAEKSGDNDLLMSYFTNVGIIFYNHREYDKAMDYYLKAVSLVKTPADETENLLWVYLNMFDVYFYQGNSRKSQHTLSYAETLLERFPTSKLAGVFYKNNAKFLNAQGNHADALKSVEKGMKHALEYNFHHDYYATPQ